MKKHETEMSTTCSKLKQGLDRFLNNLGISTTISVIEDSQEEVHLTVDPMYPQYMVSFFAQDKAYVLFRVVYDPGSYWEPPTSEEIEMFSNSDPTLVFEALGIAMVKDAVNLQREADIEMFNDSDCAGYPTVS